MSSSPENIVQRWMRHESILGPGPYWQKLLGTFLFALGFAILLVIFTFITRDKSVGAWHTLSAWVYWFPTPFVVSLCQCYSVHALFEISSRWIGARRILAVRGWPRLVYFISIPMIGVVLGWVIGFALVGRDSIDMVRADEGFLLYSVFVSIIFVVVVYHFWSARVRQAVAEQRATEAQLRMLQAQIEPHFLFNTLANVVSLIDYDAAKSKHMLETFIDYLRASLSNTRRERVALGEELALVESYLKLLQIRMDDRLRYVIDVPSELRQADVPPLSLQPLVENAIVHGLEPKIEGGTVRIKAELQRGQLVISVADDGIGLRGSTSQGSGLALQNIRERVVGQFGSKASLSIASIAADATHASGTLATLHLPFHIQSHVPS